MGRRHVGRSRARIRVERLEARCLLSVAEIPVPTAQSGPYGITAGPDGQIWFTEQFASKLGRLNPATLAVSEFATFYQGAGPTGITTGPDGKLWFTETAAGAVGSFDPSTHVDNEIPTFYGGLPAITKSADGNLWFTSTTGGLAGRINPTTGALDEYGIPILSGRPYSGPEGIAAGPDGNLWFADGGNNAIGVVNPATAAITLFPVPTANSVPMAITAGPDGNLWFTERDANRVGVINPSTHAIQEFAIPTPGADPEGIVAGPDGNVWFTEFQTGRLARINPSTHAITEFVVPYAGSNPASITAGPDGNLWFADQGTNSIGVVSLASTHLAVTQQPPSSVVAGSAFGLTVWAEDAAGNLLSSYNGPVTIALLNNPGGGTLGGTLTVNASGGVATFAGLSLTKAAAGYSFVVSASGFGADATSSLAVTPAAASQVVITTQPPSVVKVSTAFGLKVAIADAYGNIVTSTAKSLTVSLASNPSGAALGGTLTATTSQGVGTFSNLAINKTGTGYTLRIVGSGLNAAVSTPINVTKTGKALAASFGRFESTPTILAVGPVVVEGPTFWDGVRFRKRSN